MEASASPPPPPPPTVSEYDADEVVPSTANRDDVTTGGKFGRPLRNRRHLLRILLVLAQCCTQRGRDAPVTYPLSGQKKELAQCRSGNTGGNLTKPHLKSLACPALPCLPLISAGRRMHFEIMGSPRHPSSVRPSTHMALASAPVKDGGERGMHTSQSLLLHKRRKCGRANGWTKGGQANPQSARTFMARFRVVLRDLLLELHFVVYRWRFGSKDALSPIQSRLWRLSILWLNKYSVV